MFPLPIRSTLRFAAVLSVLAVAWADGVVAQTVTPVGSAPVCRGCVIEIRKGFLLGHIDDGELLGDLVHEPARTADGEYVVAGTAGLDGVLVYGRDGRCQRLIGRLGEGPGELRQVTGVRSMPGDSIMVLQIGRATVYDLAGNYARSASTGPLRASSAVSVGPDGRILYGSWISTTERAGLQFHLFDPAFESIRSFGAVPPAMQAACRRCATHATAWSRARPSHFWSLSPNAYEIKLWHESGRLVQRLPVSSAWFEPWDSDPDPPATTGPLTRDRTARPPVRPNSRLVRISEDSAGLLWVTGYVPTANWTPPPPPPPLGAPRDPDAMHRMLEQSRRSWDTIIEVIDPLRGVILASRRFERESLAAIDADTYWTPERDPRIGLVQLQIWHTALVDNRE
jgi:hypothetical protein